MPAPTSVTDRGQLKWRWNLIGSFKLRWQQAFMVADIVGNKAGNGSRVWANYCCSGVGKGSTSETSKIVWLQKEKRSREAASPRRLGVQELTLLPLGGKKYSESPFFVAKGERSSRTSVREHQFNAAHEGSKNTQREAVVQKKSQVKTSKKSLQVKWGCKL